MMTEPITCPWCSAPFTPRRTGGRRQRFCSLACRRALDKALRAWAGQELAEGRVTVAHLRHEGARCYEGNVSAA
jgi:hypothetical protein